MKLAGEGLPSLNRPSRGDLHAVLKLVTPVKLDDEQRDLVERLDGTLVPGRRAQRRPQGSLRAGSPGLPLIRLAVRCEPEMAERVLAELVEIVPGGVEEERGSG